MYYQYKCGEETIRVFVWNNEYRTAVTVEDANTKKNYERTIHEDDNGRFFTWNKKKIYLNNWIRIPLSQVKEKIEKNEWVTSEEFCQAIMSEGVENVQFIIPLNTVCGCGFLLNGNETKDVVCRIEEKFNRKLTDNYKLSFIPIEPDPSVASKRDFYVSDLVSLIKEGYVKIV